MLSYKSLDVALGFYSLKISGVTDWHTVRKKKKKKKATANCFLGQTGSLKRNVTLS